MKLTHKLLLGATLTLAGVTLVGLSCPRFSGARYERIPEFGKFGEGRKVLVVVTSHDSFTGSGKGQDSDLKTGYWLSEVTHFYEIVTAYGFEVDFMSPKGGKPPVDEASDDREEGWNKSFRANENAVLKLAQSLTPAQVQPKEYVAIYYAGGHGPLWDIPDNSDIQKIALSIYEAGGVIAAVCHGPAGILNLRLTDGTPIIKDKKVTGFTNLEEWLSGKKFLVPYLLQDELAKRGANFESGFPFSTHVEVDGRLITGQNPGSTKDLAEELVKLLHKENQTK